jgi:hypothetical protein
MAQNDKAYVRKQPTNQHNKTIPEPVSTKLLTADEQINLFANLIIDIYLQNDSKYEKTQFAHHARKTHT